MNHDFASFQKQYGLTSKLKINVVIIYVILVGRVQSLKAYNHFEAILQSKLAKNFCNMGLIRIWENLIFKGGENVTRKLDSN